MAWEKRKDYEYFYLSRRTRCGRVVKEYYGNGAAAEAAAAKLQRKRKLRREAEETIIRICQEVAASDRALDYLDDQCRLLIDAAMLAAGYHKRRSEWRKRGCQGRPQTAKKPQPKSSRNSPPSR